MGTVNCYEDQNGIFHADVARPDGKLVDVTFDVNGNVILESSNRRVREAVDNGDSIVQVAYPNDVFPAPPVPTLEEAKKAKITAIDNKTSNMLDNSGVSVEFDFGSGLVTHTFAATRTAKMNWMLLQSVSGYCMDSKIPEESFFPLNIQTFPDEAFLSLDTALAGFQFTTSVLSEIEVLRGSGAVLKNSVAAATTVEEVEAIVDNR